MFYVEGTKYEACLISLLEVFQDIDEPGCVMCTMQEVLPCFTTRRISLSFPHARSCDFPPCFPLQQQKKRPLVLPLPMHDLLLTLDVQASNSNDVHPPIYTIPTTCIHQ